MTSSSGVSTFVLFCFVFVFMLSLKPRAFVQSSFDRFFRVYFLYCCRFLLVVVVVVVVSHIQRIGCQPEKTTLHGGQSRSWSAEQGKENKKKSLAAYPPPTPHFARSEKINKITRRIYRRYAGGRSRVRTRISSARRLGLWVWLRKILHSRLR